MGSPGGASAPILRLVGFPKGGAKLNFVGFCLSWLKLERAVFPVPRGGQTQIRWALLVLPGGIISFVEEGSVFSLTWP